MPGRELGVLSRSCRKIRKVAGLTKWHFLGPGDLLGHLHPPPKGDEAFDVVDASGSPMVIDGSNVRLGRSHYVASHGQESCKVQLACSVT